MGSAIVVPILTLISGIPTLESSISKEINNGEPKSY